MAKVRVGSLYVYKAVGMDIYDSRTGLPDGEIVRVINVCGCPPANTMGHCYVGRTDDSKFIGLVLTASLSPVKKVNGKYYLVEA